MVLDKAFDTVVRSLPLPSVAEEGLIFAKNFLKDEDNREKIWDAFRSIFNYKGDVIKNAWNIKEIVKEKGAKQGISEALDIVINNAKNSKMITNKTASMLQNGKEIILENILNSKDDLLGQEEILKKINKQYDKWENAMNECDIEKMEVLGKQIKKELENLLPTIDLIKKVENIDNTINLYNNKLFDGKKQVTDLEKEILSRIA